MGYFALPTDASYKHAKLIVRGEASIDPDLALFAERFAAEFGVPLLTVDFVMWGGPTGTPGLCLVFQDWEATEKYMRLGFGTGHGQALPVTRIFEACTTPEARLRLFGIPGPVPTAETMTVCDATFLKVAADDALRSVPRSEIDVFVESLDLGDRVWQGIASYNLIVFVRAEADATQLRESGMASEWEDRYFQLVKRFDEFDAVTRNRVRIEIDSKERFDAVYQGKWYDYFK